MTTSMDTAARAIDAMLHRGYAVERDGGVWVDDLGARYITELAGELQEATWRAEDAEASEKDALRELHAAEDRLLKYDRIVRAVITVVDGDLWPTADVTDGDMLRGVRDIVEQCRRWPEVKP